jgi:putative transposase
MIHHVWTHAVAGSDLFLDVDDRRDLVARLSAVFADGGARCLGWTLMSNHFHAVVKPGHQRLGTLMQRVLTGYAMRFNGRSGRRGVLLQGRYGSRPLRDETDLLVVIRYVLRNPIAAGMLRSVEALERYPWGGLGALMGRRPPYPFESVRETLELFAPDEEAARSRLRAWLERPDTSEEPPLDALVRRVCADLAVPEADVRGGRRTQLASRARSLVCEGAVRDLQLSVTAVARVLGVSHAAVSQSLARSRRDK